MDEQLYSSLIGIATGTPQTWYRDILSAEASVRSAEDEITQAITVRVASVENRLTIVVSEIIAKATVDALTIFRTHSPSLITVIVGIYKAVVNIVDFVRYVAKIIHLDVLIKIGKLAYAISPSFHLAVDRFLSKVSDLSRQIYGNSAILSLFLENIRAVTYAVSDLVGEGYDVADIRYVRKVMDWTTLFNNHAQAFAYDPGQLMEWFADQLYTDDIDSLKTQQQGLFRAVEDVVNTADETVTKVTAVTDSVDHLIGDLPARIRAEINPAITDAIHSLNDHLQNTYGAAIDHLNHTITNVRNALFSTQTSLQTTAHVIANPGDLISGVDFLATAEKLRQEQAIGDVAYRQQHRNAEALKAAAPPPVVPLEAITEALSPPTPAPAWEQPEQPSLIPPGQQSSKQYTSWYVGDY